MELEILHAASGDKKPKLDTTTEAGRKKAGELIRAMMQQGTAIFVERGTKAYRVKNYDEDKDRLIVEVDTKRGKKLVAASGKKSKATAVAPVAGGARA